MCSRTHTITGFAEFCFPCMHVIESLRPVRLVRRDGADWIFACGDADHFEMSDWGYAHTFHLLDADPSLHALAGLRPGAQALRLTAGTPWLRLEL
jgi:hypothetical protein